MTEVAVIVGVGDVVEKGVYIVPYFKDKVKKMTRSLEDENEEYVLIIFQENGINYMLI